MVCGCAGVAVGGGALLVAFAAISSVYWPDIFAQQLSKRLIVTNESMSFNIWRETPIPMYLEVFMWNMTNAEAVLAGGSQVKPQFAQLGPYVFQEKHIKTNLTWHPENSTVSFFNNRTWHFEPLMSNGSLDDPITNVNPVILTVAYVMRLRSFLLRPFVNAALTALHEHMMLTASVHDWVFDGIEDPLIDWAIANNIDVNIPYDRFGWFYQRNGSERFDGSFNMETGAAELARLGNIARWNYASRTAYSADCGLVQGSTGELWPPELYRDSIFIFASDLCSYMRLRRAGEVHERGLTGLHFVADDAVFDNGHRYPAAACYCDAPDTSDCMPRGALNVSQCRFGAPAFVSFPHFYNADPVYLEKVDGLAPSRSQHEFSLSVEPSTGIPLAVRAQLQVNLLARHVSGLPAASALPDDTLVPMFWFRQEVRLTEEFARQARLALSLRSGVLYALYALLAVGACAVLAGAGVLLRRRLSARDPPILAEPHDAPDAPYTTNAPYMPPLAS